jgi:Ras-related protein Rab-7A
VHDVTLPPTFINLESWRENFLTQASPRDPENFPFVVIGNKIDLADERILKMNINVKKWCKENYDIPYFEASARDNINVEQAFETIAKNALAREKEQDISDLQNNIVVNQDKTDISERSSCDC